MKTHHWLVLLLGLGVLLRAALWLAYEPVPYPDTGTYWTAAQDLVNGDLARSEGRRTPGYPLIIALTGQSEYASVLAQLVMGLVISGLLFYIALSLTGCPLLALLIGLTYHLNLQQLFLEWTLLSEPTSTLSVVAVVAAAVATIDRLRAGKRAYGMMVLLGVLAGFCILVRPQYVFLPAVSLVAVLYAARGGVRILSRRAVTFGTLAVAPTVILVALWCAFVYAKVGMFTLSTQSGFGLVNHVISYIELAPDRYAAIRDVLLKHRARRMAEVGHDRNTIWYAWPEIQRTTGYSLPAASREYQRMVAEMVILYPGRYAVSVANAWIDFWTVPILWDLSRFRAEAWRPALAAVWWVEHKLLRLTNLVFVLIVASVLVLRSVRKRFDWDSKLTVISAVILLSSLLQAMADQGASSRYAVTIQALVVLVVAVCAARALGYARRSRSADSAATMQHASLTESAAHRA